MSDKVKNYLSVAGFAFFGGMARAYLNTNFHFYGTFWGNIIGCFLLAFFTYFFFEFKDFYEWLNVGICTGFVGAFTTFSTFNLEVLKNFDAHLSDIAFIYLFSSIIFGFVFAYIGAHMGETLSKIVTGRVK